MSRRWLHRLTLAVTALVIAVASVQGAALMAPTGPAPAHIHHEMAPGGEAGDNQGRTGSPEGHKHHCPFCHKLGEAPVAVLAPRELRVVYVQTAAPGASQPVASQPCNEDNPARAPPRAV